MPKHAFKPHLLVQTCPYKRNLTRFLYLFKPKIAHLLKQYNGLPLIYRPKIR